MFFRECLITATFAACTLGQVASPTSQPAEERYWKKDPVALRQEVDTFSSLLDGHPAAPGDWELQLDSGWLALPARPNTVPLTSTVKYTPHRYTESGYEFFEAMQLSLSMPLEMVRGDYDGSGDMTFGWQERWFAEHDGIPTLATLAQVRMPSGHDSRGADGTFTGILDKDFGPGTMYLNGWVRTASENNYALTENYVPPRRQLCERVGIRPFQWGARIGYKLPLGARTSLVADYVHQTSQLEGNSNTNMLELGAQFRTKHHLSFGPGIVVGLDGQDETPRFGAGFRIIYLFNARQPPAS